MSKPVCVFLLVIALGFLTPNLFSYSILTHEAVVDAQWKESIEPLLRKRFPRLSAGDFGWVLSSEPLDADRAPALGPADPLLHAKHPGRPIVRN